ncbi:GNAT family N-acetyltransferase [Arthrobacter sp. TMN-37]
MTDAVPTLRTPRFILRPLTPADEDAVMGYRGDPRLSRFLPHPPMDQGQYPEWLAERTAEISLRNPGDRRFLGIEPASSGGLIGDVLLKVGPDTVEQGEIGMILQHDAKGQGYAAEIGDAILAFGFEHLGLHRIVGRADELNVPSRRTMERLGMRLEGHFLQDRRQDGTWANTVFYAILRSEWQTQRRLGDRHAEGSTNGAS